MSTKKYFPVTILQFVKIYLTAILFFALFRIILFVTEIDRINSSDSKLDIVLAFIMGMRFDIVISGYILVFPFAVLTILSFFDYKFIFIKRFFFIYILALFFLAFMVCAVDIPYFNQFYSRFSISAFEWIDSPVFVFNMIIQEPRYWLVVIPFAIFVFLFYKLLKKIYFGVHENSFNNKSLSLIHISEPTRPY